MNLHAPSRLMGPRTLPNLTFVLSQNTHAATSAILVLTFPDLSRHLTLGGEPSLHPLEKKGEHKLLHNGGGGASWYSTAVFGAYVRQHEAALSPSVGSGRAAPSPHVTRRSAATAKIKTDPVSLPLLT